ncbi:MAG: hypothetical protein L6R38_001257 [Xanthoria sp. 2 TBL-2021]|nr:MAG: hypothetical protein L6R38_001257 [Xanthoria sp. 2 TBL-2021]
MDKLVASIHCIEGYGRKRTNEILESLGKNRLWQRQLKNVAATMILVSICLVPRISGTLGRAAYLGAITTVFAHPGRRFGQLVEALILALAGTFLGLAWSLFGLYLSSLVVSVNPPAAYSIRGAFLAFALFFHGFIRSNTPRLFIFVLLLIIVSIVTLTSTVSTLTAASATQILYPILAAVGVILVVSLIIFPEFSSSFLGETTIETLHDAAEALQSAGHYFTVSKQIKATPNLRLDEDETKAEKSNQTTKQPPKKSITNGVLHRFLRSKRPKSSDADAASEDSIISLQDLVGAKAKLRNKLSTCKAAQTECAFEVAFAVLPPRRLKPISNKSMKKLVANVVAVIGACESKFALLGESAEPDRNVTKTINLNSKTIGRDEGNNGNDVLPTPDRSIADEKTELDLIKPKREIEFGDARLLQHLLKRISVPYTKFNTVISRAINCVNICIAYSYDVPNLPSGAKSPKGLVIEEVDLYLEELGEALRTFDSEIAASLEGAVEIQGIDGQQLDVMPREEIFLVASFVLNLRQAATHIEEMLQTSRSIVLQRQARHGRRRLYAPKIKWSKWLYSGGEELEALPTGGRIRGRSGEEDKKANDVADVDTVDSEENLVKSASAKQDLEQGTKSAQRAPKSCPQPNMQPTMPASDPGNDVGLILRLRARLADGLEWAQRSDDLLYAFKLSVAVLLVTWPAFFAHWNQWYSLNRGLWAALQLVFVMEVSIGSSVMMFILRGVGTTLGCLWGWAALEARGGDRVVIAAMVCVGLIPSTYVQLGSKYPKAGMVCIVSICVLALSTELQTVPGSATETFLRRWLAFVVGGVVALVIEIGFLPVKARTRLVESLTAAIRRISEMETCIAVGIEEGVNLDVYEPKALIQFERASGKANVALTAAEMFLPFCNNEPRIKGSFEGLAEIYGEILFVLHQIVDRMDNMLQLRSAYGSGPLEELNAQIYPYRRNVAGSINLTLFAVQNSLTTKLALPQFFPSARLAHLRMINRVREVVQQRRNQEANEDLSDPIQHQTVRRKYMAWNAASAARAEIIEYLEELVDLSKLLVGANEFRSGLLMRNTYNEYIQGLGGVAATKAESSSTSNEATVETMSEDGDALAEAGLQRFGTVRRRRLTTIESAGSAEERVPASLQRIQSRKIEAGIRRQATKEGWNR